VRLTRRTPAGILYAGSFSEEPSPETLEALDKVADAARARMVGEPDPPLYVPPDIFEAQEEWGANCGPCALAAISGKTLAEVRPAIVNFRGCMNPTELQAALYRLGLDALKKAMPVRSGVAHVLFDGPWSAAGPRVAYRYSHCIAYRRVSGSLMVYDCNAGEAGGWLSLPEWEQEVLPLLLPKRGTGYHVNAWLEVRLDWPLGTKQEGGNG
jgi:hypothetical protein